MLAGLYNLLFGVWALLFPFQGFDLAGMPRPLYPFLWQCIGMIVGVYGVGYVIAAFRPLNHWPIVLVGLMGKIAGPIGFFGYVIAGEIPWQASFVILTNDLIWIVPFTWILCAAYQSFIREPDRIQYSRSEANSILSQAVSTAGRTLGELSQDKPVLMVFTRHTGCIFCREMLWDLAQKRRDVESMGVQIVLVLMSGDNSVMQLIQRYKLDDLPRFIDPNREMYLSAGLRRGSILQLFHPRIWIRALQAVWQLKEAVGMLKGDGFQLQGLALFHQGRLLAAYEHASADEVMDYQSFLELSKAKPGPSLNVNYAGALNVFVET